MQRIKDILNTLLMLWLLYIAVKYLLLAKSGYDLFSLLLGGIALIIVSWRVYKWLQSRKKDIDPEGYAYIHNMLNVAKGVLVDDYKPFGKEIKCAIKEKKHYLIGFDGKKYYTSYISPENHEAWNKRYIKMAKDKDIKITKRNGLDIKEMVTINYVGDDLERYMFVYLQEKERLLQFKQEELVENIKKLIAPYRISLDFKKVKEIYRKYADSNERYVVEFYNEEIWHIKDIEAFKEIFKQLKEKGYFFIICAYGSDRRWFCVVDSDTLLEMMELQTIDIYSVNKLLTDDIKGRSYTYQEQFEYYYESVKKEILEMPHETLYKVDAHKELRDTSLSVIGGRGVGLSDDKYPKFGDKPMTHLLTLDLEDFPNLKNRYPKKRAISLYMNEYRGENEAYEIDTKETTVVLLSQKQIDEERLTNLTVDYFQTFSLRVIPYIVPKKMFNMEVEEESITENLKNYFFNFNYVGGEALWMQNEEEIPNFIMQINQSLFSNISTTPYDGVNFADGIMYMFEETAFWQCG